MPGEPEVRGLLALMLLIHSRRAAHVSTDGDLVFLADQDRRGWDHDLIREGQALVRQCLDGNQAGPYQIQAAMNAVHSDAPEASRTDWRQILQLSDQLLDYLPTPIVALNRAVAVGQVEGAASALALVGRASCWIPGVPRSSRQSPALSGRVQEAALAYDAAIAVSTNPAEATLLRRRRAALEPTETSRPAGAARRPARSSGSARRWPGRCPPRWRPCPHECKDQDLDCGQRVPEQDAGSRADRGGSGKGSEALHERSLMAEIFRPSSPRCPRTRQGRWRSA